MFDLIVHVWGFVMNSDPVVKSNGKQSGLLWIKAGGVPVLYLLIMLVVIVLMGFVPASVVIGESGGGWPLHDAIHPFVGLLLGPLIGSVVSSLGFLLSNVITPYTSLGDYSFLIGAMSAFTVGMVAQRGKWYWFVPWVIIAGAHILYFFETRGFGISPWLWFSNTFTVTIGLLLTAVPAIRQWAWSAISSADSRLRLGLGLYIFYFLGSVGGVQLYWAVVWPRNPWGAEFWPELVLVIFLERTIFPLIGVFITIFIIPIFQKLNLPKPRWAGY